MKRQRNPLFAWPILLPAVFLLIFLASPRQAGADVTVTSIMDPTEAGKTTLRDAIRKVNMGGGNEKILFAIPAAQRDATTGKFIIKPAQEMETVKAPNITIDGYTQTGSRANTKLSSNDAVQLILLDGTISRGVGLRFIGGGSTVRGLILRNFVSGVLLTGQGGNTIEGCVIGPNPGNGVDVNDVPNNTIGGTAARSRNVLSGNQNGIFINGATSVGNKIQGNFIGTDFTGAAAMQNSESGVLLENGENTTIGGATKQIGTPPGNVISGNGGPGINIVNVAAKQGGTFVQGNMIGTDTSGSKALGNKGGVLASNSIMNSISRNLISGNGPPAQSFALGDDVGFGISLNQSSDFSDVTDNLIGTDYFGRKRVPNRTNGILVSQTSNCNIGPGNVVSANDGSGVKIATPNSLSNIVRGCFIGTDSAGIRPLGNIRDGVLIADALRTTVGGVTNVAGRGALKPNTIADNGSLAPLVLLNVGAGVRITGANAKNNRVLNNFIGTDTTGKRQLGNFLSGVQIENGASDNKVAQTVIAFNLKGITVTGLDAAGMAPKRNNLGDPNSIFDNRQIGIDLGDDGPTPLSPDEGTGPNNLQHVPVLLSANVSGDGSATLVTFIVNSVNIAPFHVEFYDNDDLDPAGMAEGKTFLGATDVPAGVMQTIALPPAGILTATATDAEGNTSEFSVRLQVPAVSTDVTAQVFLIESGYNFYQSENLYLQVVTVQNLGLFPIPGPVSLVLDNLSANAALFNRDGITQFTPPLGSPYITVLGNADVLPPGQTATVVLSFANPTNRGITYTPRVLAGAGAR